MSKRIRLDEHLTQSHLCSSLKEAQSLIIQGCVIVNNTKILKPGTLIESSSNIHIKSHYCPYVSRAGLKLASAHRSFGFDCHDIVALDIGISTGGFTDFLKKNGAKAVFGVDVGYGIVDYTLRQWSHLILLERMNARHLTKEILAEAAKKQGHPGIERDIRLVVIDVSFISGVRLMPVILECLKPGAHIVLMLKPQFEALPEEVESGGIVSDTKTRERVLNRSLTQLKLQGTTIKGIHESDISGFKKKNKEIFLYLEKQ
jgi:23S rRNA (cytidine1920-2'-O)/16S rRNA (cytidine1409-2'-O)-methyltransferase